MSGFDHVWYWRARLPERKGQRCRVLVYAPAMNSIAVQFEDGAVYITSRYAARRAHRRAAKGEGGDDRG